MKECLHEPWKQEVSSTGMNFSRFEPALCLSPCVHKLQVQNGNMKRSALVTALPMESNNIRY